MRKSEPHSEAGNPAGPRAGKWYYPVSKRAALAAITVAVQEDFGRRPAVIRLFSKSRMREIRTYGSVVGPTWQRAGLPDLTRIGNE